MVKERGRDAAIELGNELVQGDLKVARLKEWTSFCDSHLNEMRGNCFASVVDCAQISFKDGLSKKLGFLFSVGHRQIQGDAHVFDRGT